MPPVEPSHEQELLAGLRRTLPELIAETLPRLLGPVDEALRALVEERATWVALRRGQAPFRQGDAPEALYLVAHGRLELTATDARGRAQRLGEVGRGESCGEAALFADVPHQATAHALRDTVLLRLAAADFEALVERHPRALRALSRASMRRSLRVPELEPRPPPPLNIAVVPAAPGVAVRALTARLVAALGALGPTLHVDAALLATLPRSESLPADSPEWMRFSAWLDARGRDHRFIVLEGDESAVPWMRRALHEADHVLLVADARHDPAPHPLERSLLGPWEGPHHARRTLVLLHPPGTALPRGTARWLDARDVQEHRHARLDRPGDVERLARALAGEAVGLVLGAGGARGFAHVGTMRALEEAGVAVDHLGGPSIGAVVGALFALGRTPDEVMELGRRIVGMKPFSDYALPFTSLLHGRRVEAVADMLFGDVAIEDLWVPFFCTACDLSRFEQVVYERGPLAAAVLASAALPLALPPQVRDGRLMIDGGTADLLPGSLMRARCPGALIAVDVSSERILEYGAPRYPTSWRALWERVRPGGRRTPLLPELFLRAASYGIVQRLEAVAEDADLFLRPPVERFGTVEIDAGEEIARLGQQHARERLRGFRPALAARRKSGRGGVLE